MFNELITKLSIIPSQLEQRWYQKVASICTMPLRVIVWPIRALFMSVIVEISWSDRAISKEDITTLSNEEYDIEMLKYSIPRNTNCSMIIAAKKDQEEAIENRKLVIMFPGNAMSAVDSVQGFISIVNNKKGDLLAIHYPPKATTSKELVDAGVSAVLRAINAGYKPENITITGHSLGGAVSALVLKEMKKYLEIETFAGYVNHRSFTNLGDFIAAQKTADCLKQAAIDKLFEPNNNQSPAFITHTKSSWLGWFINGLAWCLGVQLDAEKALKAQNLPVKQMKFYAIQHDCVIYPGACITIRRQEDTVLSLPTKIKYLKYNHVRTETTTYGTMTTYIPGHNEPFANSLYRQSKQSTDWRTYAEKIKYLERIIHTI